MRIPFHLQMQHKLMKYVVGVGAWLMRDAINSSEAFSHLTADSGDLVERVL